MQDQKAGVNIGRQDRWSWGTVRYAYHCLVSLAQDHDARQPETAYLIKFLQGPALYRAYCAVCHGSDDKGGGPMVTHAALTSGWPDQLVAAASLNARALVRQRDAETT